jgi:methylenetetrahydrofolate dehydrogenase (NADP+)/methenyltetrahydrofolate cyclohydrolase
METTILDGRAIARRIRDDVAAELRADNLNPGLAVVLAGDDPASHLYVGLKEKACAEAGIRFEKHLFAADASENEITSRLEDLNRRDDIDAILVQLPLPAHLDEDAVIRAMSPEKDADGFHPANLERFLKGDVEAVPGLAEVVVTLAEAAGRPLSGAVTVIVANSAVFAAPIRKMLELRGATVEIASDLAIADRLTRAADLIVIAVGRPKWLTAAKTKPGAVIIDVGTNRVEGLTVGDADFEDLRGVAAAITPVPGGVGPVTVAMLLRSVLRLAKRRK